MHTTTLPSPRPLHTLVQLWFYAALTFITGMVLLGTLLPQPMINPGADLDTTTIDDLRPTGLAALGEAVRYTGVEIWHIG